MECKEVSKRKNKGRLPLVHASSRRMGRAERLALRLFIRRRDPGLAPHIQKEESWPCALFCLSSRRGWPCAISVLARPLPLPGLVPLHQEEAGLVSSQFFLALCPLVSRARGPVCSAATGTQHMRFVMLGIACALCPLPLLGVSPRQG